MVLLRLGAWHHGITSLGHADLVPSRDALDIVFASALREQCVAASAIKPDPSRRRSVADAVQNRVLSDCGWHRCLRDFDVAASTTLGDVLSAI